MDKRWLLGKISNHNINRKDGTFVKTAVICMNGFEEVEGLTVVDMLRRLEIDCDIVGKGAEVTGSHGIVIKADRLLEEIKSEDYSAIILPGGLPGATNLRDDSKVISLVNEMNKAGKIVAAICAAPIVLERAGVLEGREFTAYPGVGEKIEGGNFKEELVVRDGNIITSRGPATSLEFAFAIAEALGVNADSQRKATLWDKVTGR